MKPDRACSSIMVTTTTFTITHAHLRDMINKAYGVEPSAAATIVAAELDEDGEEIVRVKPDTLTVTVETDLDGAKRIERKLKKVQS